MSVDDEIRSGLDEAANLVPLDQTVALDAAKSLGRKGVRKRRVLAAGGGVLTTSALLVGALTLAQDQPSRIAVADPSQPSVCQGAFPTVTAGAGYDMVNDRTWMVDGHLVTIVDDHDLSEDTFRFTTTQFEWIDAGGTDREVVRTIYSDDNVTEIGYDGTHLPPPCTVVVRTDVGYDDGGQALVEELETHLVWPASGQPQPIVVADADPACGPVAPVMSAELDDQYGLAVLTVDDATGQLSMLWADDHSSVEVRHPAGVDADVIVTVPSHRGGDECGRAELITAGTVSTREATVPIRAVDVNLVDAETRLGTGVATSSAVLNAPPVTEVSDEVDPAG